MLDILPANIPPATNAITTYAAPDPKLHAVPPQFGLAMTAYAELKTFFARVDHTPSAEQWTAIRDLLDHLELAATHALPPALYVSAIPAGTGKSQSIAAFGRALMAAPGRDDTGMLILVNRIAEAADMAAELSRYRSRLCVITSKDAVNALGKHGEADGAQVCIATQAALKMTLRTLAGTPFAAAARFHYRGTRRAVVCWDESFAFNRPVTLNADTVGSLARAMRRQSEDAAHALKRWSSDLDECPGGLCSVPDFEGLGVDFRRLEDDVGDRDDMVADAKALAVISGDEGFVTREGNTATLITHYPEIPASLMPVVVTDASARMNASYQMMRRYVPLHWLREAPKTYHNLTIRIVPTAASRSVYRDTKAPRGRDLIDMAVRYIKSVPVENVLTIGYRGRFAMRGVEQTELEAAIRARLPADDQDRVKYLAYGAHTATNAFKDCRRVILLGLNFMPKSLGHAASGAALNLDLINDHPTEDEIRQMIAGMLMDSTLQALLRGNARTAVGADCGPMEAVIPQTRQTGIPLTDYRAMFPGATIIEDHILLPPKPLTGRLKELATIAARRLTAGEREMTNASLYAEMGMSQGHFSRLVTKPEWQAHVARMGLHPCPLRGRAMGLRVVA